MFTTDLNPHDDFQFPDVGQSEAKIHNMARITASSGDTYLLCTKDIPNNLDPSKNYLRPPMHIVSKLQHCIKKAHDIGENKFQDIYRILAQFAKWRANQNGRTILVCEHPPMHHVASWERAFSNTGMLLAWLDVNGSFAVSLYSHAPDVKKSIIQPIRIKRQYDEVMKMSPGQMISFAAVAGKSKREITNARQNARLLVRRVEKKMQDRRFSISITGASAAKTCYIYRLTQEEYDEWTNGFPYEAAVLQYAGGTSNTVKLKQTMRE